jgi:hypothetical protein
MLLGNRSVLLNGPGRFFSGTLATYRSQWQKSGAARGRFLSLPQLSATPTGYRHPYGWVIPNKGGELASYTLILGDGDTTFSIAGGRNGEAVITSFGDMSATGQTVASLIASMSGTGLLNNADVRAVLGAIATLAGAGTVDADIEAEAWAEALITGVSSLSLVSYGTGELDADISVASGSEVPTTDQIASAVWSTAQGELLYALAHNRVVTDPVAGTFTVYANDDTTVLYTADLWQDAAGSTPYIGAGADRRDRLT